MKRKLIKIASEEDMALWQHNHYPLNDSEEIKYAVESVKCIEVRGYNEFVCLVKLKLHNLFFNGEFHKSLEIKIIVIVKNYRVLDRYNEQSIE